MHVVIAALYAYDVHTQGFPAYDRPREFFLLRLFVRAMALIVIEMNITYLRLGRVVSDGLAL